MAIMKNVWYMDGDMGRENSRSAHLYIVSQCVRPAGQDGAAVWSLQSRSGFPLSCRGRLIGRVVAVGV